jgi:hypothetical protein
MREFLAKVDKTLRYYGKQAGIALRGAWCRATRPGARRPVFVVGCSRAGTTLVYKTLSESRELGTLQRETHDFWADLHPLEENDWRSHVILATDASDQVRDYVSCYFYSRTGKQRFVDKNNQNGLCVPFLHALYPDACFVYVKRSPGDNINSLIEGWAKPNEFATWSAGLPAKVAIENGTYRRWCFFLPEGWREYVNASVEEVCAYQYNEINRAILDAKNDVPVQQWYEVCYEDLVRDPVKQFSKLFRACGLTFDERLARHCKDVLSLPYNAFSEIRLDKWKDGHNRERIMRVATDVSEVAALMGYQP